MGEGRGKRATGRGKRALRTHISRTPRARSPRRIHTASPHTLKRTHLVDRLLEGCEPERLPPMETPGSKKSSGPLPGTCATGVRIGRDARGSATYVTSVTGEGGSKSVESAVTGDAQVALQHVGVSLLSVVAAAWPAALIKYLGGLVLKTRGEAEEDGDVERHQASQLTNERRCDASHAAGGSESRRNGS